MAKETLGKSNSIIFITIVMQLHTRLYVSPVGKKNKINKNNTTTLQYHLVSSTTFRSLLMVYTDHLLS